MRLNPQIPIDPSGLPTTRPARVDARDVQPLRQAQANPRAELAWRMQRTGQWLPGQTAGRRWGVACVSLEITQRCNLDCTLCYLSESSEAVRDFPLEEVYRRIDLVLAHYGPGTDVLVSGGEPTLRPRDELIAIVQRITQRGLRASLFTNGILASRALLQDLAVAGLCEVAFHVDLSQQRTGYRSEADLNALRLEYIARAGGLKIGVFFNTTVFDGNRAEIPMLAAFFVAQAGAVRFASFQLQADTGRGVLGARGPAIDQAGVAAALQRGTGAALSFNVLSAGHQACNQNTVLLLINGRAYDAFADRAFIQRFMRETAGLRIDRHTPGQGLRSLAAALLQRPGLLAATAAWLLGFGWGARGDLWAARGRVGKLTFFTHNFMDACALDAERIEACVFMAITQDGPISMCAFNAQRDDYLLRPLALPGGPWQPLRALPDGVREQPIKWLKGRAREAALAARKASSRQAST